jgi:hypothetical protein
MNAKTALEGCWQRLVCGRARVAATGEVVRLFGGLTDTAKNRRNAVWGGLGWRY